MNGAGLFVAVKVSHGEALQIAVESDADEFAPLIDCGTAIIAAAGVGCTHEIELSYGTYNFARLNPTRRYQPGALVVFAVVESAERGGIGLRYSGAIGIAFDYAEFDARRAGAIGVIGGAEQLEAELRDLLGGRNFERPNDVLVLFAQTQRGGVDGLRQGDYRVTRFERGVAIGGQGFA